MLISGYARYDKKGCTMLYVVKMGWQEPGHPERVDGVLRYALRGVAHTVIDSLEPFVSLCTRRSGGKTCASSLPSIWPGAASIWPMPV